MKLRRGALPADVSHIGGTGRKRLALIQRQQYIVHRPGRLHRFDGCGVAGILPAHPGQIPFGLVGGGQGCGKGLFLPGIDGNAYLAEIPVQQRLQRVVGDRLRQAVDKFAPAARFGHQGRTFGNLIHTGLQLQRLFDPVGAHHIQHRGPGLHYIGAAAAGVGHGIVDAGLRLHVLPQELHAEIHQRNGVQRAAAFFGVAGGVGRHPVEGILHLNTGVAGAGGHLVAVIRVPGQRRIQAVPQLFPRHKGLGRAALLAGAAVQHHRTGAPGLLQIMLDAQRGGQRPRPQQMMSAAVAGTAGGQFPTDRAAALLRQSGEGVVFRQNADDRPSRPKGGGKGGGDPADPLLNGKALLPQHPDIQRRRLDLLQR